MRRRWRSIVGVLAVLIGFAYAIAYLIDEPLRRQLEQRMNAALSGYHVQVGRADFHPLGFGLDLDDVTVVPDATPDQPLAQIKALRASVQWRALVYGRLVADFSVDTPKLHIDRRLAEREARDQVPVQERGWQRAVEAIYPLKINEFQVKHGEVTYVDASEFRPLRITDLELRAANIRNVRSPDRTYPSEIRLTATLLETSPLRVDGRADFLAEPFAAFDVHADLERLELDYLKPVLARSNLAVRRGTVSIAGAVEYGPKVAMAHLEDLTIKNADIDYVHTRATAPAEAERAEAGAKAIKRATSEPNAITVRADRIDISDSTFGYDDRAADPPYRVFLVTRTATLHDFSNQIRESTADLKLRGALMGDGRTEVDGTFRPEVHGPDFDLATRIEHVDMRKLNDLWRAYAGVDVARGDFSFYSEMRVRNGRVEGYVKPLFQNVDVYSPEQDKNKPLPKKVYEGIVGGVAALLQNRQEDAVATRTELSGPLTSPNTSTWQAVLGLLQNAFFQAILPGLERQGRR